MKILLKTIAQKDKYTIGKMYIDDVYFCDTLEDRVRDLTKEKKVMHETAIPAGTYQIVLSMSNRFKRILPLLLDVPHFTGIRIHRGNTDKDTSGCILVGRNTQVGKVLQSALYEKMLIEKLKEATYCTIKIERL